MRFLLALLLATAATPSAMADVAHYRPGAQGLLDTLVPPRGLHVWYAQGYYRGTTWSDRDGERVREVTIPFPLVGSVTLDLEVDLDVHYQQPGVTLVPWEIESIGLRFGLQAYLRLGTASPQVNFFTRRLLAQDTKLGDLFVAPVWVGWQAGRVALSFSYGVYAPAGDYDSRRAANAGLGYWSHQLQLTGRVLVDPARLGGPAVRATFEVNHEREGGDRRAGDVLTLEYGWSQTLVEYQGLGLGLTLAGSSQLQVSDDRGRDRFLRTDGFFQQVLGQRIPSDERVQVHAVGGELNVSYEPWGLSFTALGSYEYEARSRVRGWRIGFTVRIGLPLLRRRRYGPA